MFIECCVCYERRLQHDAFICNHPLCGHCYENLRCPKSCPLCRTKKQIPYLKVVGKYIRITKLTNFLLYSSYYNNFMSQFLKNRTSQKTILKVNKYLVKDKFVIIKNQCYSISDLSVNELMNFIFKCNTKSYSNIQVFKDEVNRRIHVNTL